jgi:hypothetical protein
MKVRALELLQIIKIHGVLAILDGLATTHHLAMARKLGGVILSLQAENFV